MATESTAIVNLLDLVKNQKPLERDSSDDMLFGGRVRFDAMAMPAPARPVMLPLPQPFINQPAAAIEQKTHRVMRVAEGVSPKKLALPVGLFVVAMVLLSIYLAKSHTKPTAKATTIVHAPQPTVQVDVPVARPPAPAPAPAPEVVAAAAPAAPVEQKAQPTVTEIPQPTVTEIQPTVPTVAEAQPIVPTVPTVTETPVADEQPVAADEAKPVASKRKHHHEHSAAKRTKKETRVATAETPKPAKSEAHEKLGGKGQLQISSSPKRELWVDGKSTKASTPQTVKLAPGTHNITLFDKKTRSAKTFQVEIEANKTLRVSKSY